MTLRPDAFTEIRKVLRVHSGEDFGAGEFPTLQDGRAAWAALARLEREAAERETALAEMRLKQAAWESANETLAARVREVEAERDEAQRVVRLYHEWLERVEKVRDRNAVGYIGLDHAAGGNVEGCSGCAVLASPEFDHPDAGRTDKVKVGKDPS